MGVSPRRYFLPLGCGYKGVPGLRLTAGNPVSVPGNNFLASCQPDGTQPTSGDISPVPTWAETILVSKKLPEIAEALDLLGHRMT